MTESPSRTSPLLDARVLQMEPLTQWWHHEDVVCVALRSVNRTPVVTVGGALDRRASQPCRRALEAALRARPRCVLVDLTAVTSSDDYGVGLLEAMRRAAAWHGSRLWLAAVPEAVRVRLEQSGLLVEFPTSRNAARAIEEIKRLPARSAEPRHRPSAPCAVDSRTA